MKYLILHLNQLTHSLRGIDGVFHAQLKLYKFIYYLYLYLTNIKIIITIEKHNSREKINIYNCFSIA